jgi:hypothetical protein
MQDWAIWGASRSSEERWWWLRHCLFDKPVAQGGMAISRYTASGVLALAILICVLVFPQRPALRSDH